RPSSPLGSVRIGQVPKKHAILAKVASPIPPRVPHAQHHLLRRQRRRNLREHLQCAEALSLLAQDGEDAAAKTAGLAEGGAAGPFQDCQTLPISDAEKKADLRAEMPAWQLVKFYPSSGRSWNSADSGA